MTAQSTALAWQRDMQGPSGESVTVETRFGPYEFDAASTLYLPQGLLGFGNFHRFGIGNLPDPNLPMFKLLQSLENLQLSFIVNPLDDDQELIAEADLVAACDATGTAREDAGFMLVVTLRQELNGLSLSVNLRAPLVVDIQKRMARQIVLQNPDYPVRYAIPAMS